MSNNQPEWLSEGTDTDASSIQDALAEARQADLVEDRERIIQPRAERPIVRPERSYTSEGELQRYQQEMRDRIPGLIGKILSSEYQPAPRKSGHKITGELGRKGRRGL